MVTFPNNLQVLIIIASHDSEDQNPIDLAVVFVQAVNAKKIIHASLVTSDKHLFEQALHLALHV